MTTEEKLIKAYETINNLRDEVDELYKLKDEVETLKAKLAGAVGIIKYCQDQWNKAPNDRPQFLYEGLVKELGL